jgi:hypothetical protein
MIFDMSQPYESAMSKLYSRRDFLRAALAAGVLPILLPGSVRAASPGSKRLVAGTRVLEVNGRPIQGAVRDTVLVTPMRGRIRIAFDADNPGRWAFHCHNLYHMVTGMLTEFRYEGIAV